jgi:hypothetical protein
VPDPGRAVIGRAQARPWRPAGLFALAADRGPVPARAWLQIQGPELIGAEDHFGVARLRGHLAVRDRVQLLDPCLLRRYRGSLEAFQVFSR